MEQQERDAIAALCVMAAFADGQQSDAERDAVKRILDQLGGSDLAQASQRVLMRQTTMEAEATRLTSPEARQLAYEMALAVCHADGSSSEGEDKFLDRLRAVLALPPGPARETRDRSAQVAGATPQGAAPQPPAAGPAPGPVAAPVVDEAALDKMIQDHAVLTGALELLPHSLATLAIIPVQMKLVYGIGERYGYKLDSGHVKDFLGTLGIGLTGQVLEGVARRLLGGFGRMAGGPLIGGLLGAATGVGVSFATTWALGQVARSYYASGRRLDLQATQALFQRKLDEARGLYPRFRGDIEQRARTIDVGTLPALVKGA